MLCKSFSENNDYLNLFSYWEEVNFRLLLTRYQQLLESDILWIPVFVSFHFVINLNFHVCGFCFLSTTHFFLFFLPKSSVVTCKKGQAAKYAVRMQSDLLIYIAQ